MKDLYRDIVWECRLPNEFRCEFKRGRHIFNSLKIHRDANYNLMAELDGQEYDEFLKTAPYNPLKSEIAEMDDKGPLEISSEHGSLRGTIKNFWFKQIVQGTNVSATAEIEDLVLARFPKKPKAMFKKYWFLNGISRRGLYYDNNLYIEASHQLSLSFGKEQTFGFSRKQTDSLGAFSISLQFREKPFVFGYIGSEALEINAGSFIQVDIVNDFSNEELKILEYFLTFIIGKPLMPIGHTTFDEGFFPLERRYKSSFVDNLDQLLGVKPFSPVPLRYAEDFKTMDLKSTLNLLLQLYDKAYEEFNLNRIVEYISGFQVYPIDTQIQPLSSAFDVLKSSWFKSSKSRSAAKYLNDVEYQEVIKDSIESVKSKLAGFEFSDKIIRKLKAANQMGSNEQQTIFFKEIGLVLSPHEEKAIQERNPIVHGFIEEKNIGTLISLTGTFYNILSRSILKIIGYTGSYTDYSNGQENSRPINSPSHGSEISV